MGTAAWDTLGYGLPTCAPVRAGRCARTAPPRAPCGRWRRTSERRLLRRSAKPSAATLPSLRTCLGWYLVKESHTRCAAFCTSSVGPSKTAQLRREGATPTSGEAGACRDPHVWLRPWFCFRVRIWKPGRFGTLCRSTAPSSCAVAIALAGRPLEGTISTRILPALAGSDQANCKRRRLLAPVQRSHENRILPSRVAAQQTASDAGL